MKGVNKRFWNEMEFFSPFELHAQHCQLYWQVGIKKRSRKFAGMTVYKSKIPMYFYQGLRIAYMFGFHFFPIFDMETVYRPR